MKKSCLFSVLAIAAIACSKSTNNSKVSPPDVNPNIRAATISEGNSVVLLPSFPKSKTEIDIEEKKAVALVEVAYNQVAAAKANSLSFQNTFKVLDAADSAFWQITNRINIVGDLGDNAEVRDIAKDAAARLEQFMSAQSLRSDVYASLQAAANLGTPTNAYDAKLQEVYIRAFKKNGADKSDAEKEKIAQIQKEISEAKTAFDNGLSAAGAKKVLLTQEESASLPAFIQAMIKQYASAEGFLVPRGNLNVWGAIMTYSNVEALREKAWMNRYSFAKENSAASLVLVNKRKELAGLLGYSSWAALQTDGRMAENVENVDKLYAQIIGELNPIKAKETEKFTNLKRQITNNPNAVLKAWDLPYLEQKIKETEFNFDPEQVRDYFPVTKVKNGIFAVYGQIYGVEFKKHEGNFDTWYPGIDLWEIRDASTKKLMGVLYLDLYARSEQGKRTGAWMNQIVAGQSLEDKQLLPTVQVVANFRPKLPEQNDSYMSFDDMKTFFHEFGHAMHSLVSEVPHSSLTIDGVAWDFVEAPSQIMEDFVSDYKVVSQLSAHKDTGAPLPEELLKRINDSKKISTGYYWMRQIALGKLDWALYSRDNSAADLNMEEMQKISDDSLSQYWIEVPAGLGFVGAFSHINSGGYSAGYYSYLWAAVVAADCSAEFKKSEAGYLNPELGMKWRKEVLSQGAAKNAAELVHNFLGRDYNTDAFIKALQN